jgi:uncharacterized protein (UPF0303 family)
MTTGGFTSAQLSTEESIFALSSLDVAACLEIGEIAVGLGRARDLAIAVEVRFIQDGHDWIVFHASLPGSKPENDSWIARKARVVLASGHSTIHERVISEERGVDWYAEHNLPETTHAIHGGGLPLNVVGHGLSGILLISGLPQVDDHLLGVEVLTEFLARKGEND